MKTTDYFKHRSSAWWRNST